MISPLRGRVCVGFCFTGVLVSLGWFVVGVKTAGMGGGRAIAEVGAVGMDGAPEPRWPEIVTWEPPPRDHGGEAWAFDLFTPPELHQHPITSRWTIGPPLVRHSVAPTDAREAEAGLRLVGVEPTLFPLQLVGYTGSDERPIGVFEAVASGEVFLARAGQRIGPLGFLIVSVQVQRTALVADAGASVRTAMAAVRDERSGVLVTLSDRERYVTDQLAARVTLDGCPLLVREGDHVQQSGQLVRVAKIQLAPPAVTVTKLLPGRLDSEQSVLVIASGFGAEPSAGNL